MNQFISSRGHQQPVSGAEAILHGLAPDGGLYCPTVWPTLSPDSIGKLLPMSYAERSAYLISLFLSDVSYEELLSYTREAYATFDNANPAPLRKLSDSITLLDLWHGPTAAFKDVALQLLPFLLTASVKTLGEQRNVCILAATSGDTGKAALEGFKNRDGCAVFVFYPQGGVSQVQQLQMTTQEGRNVGVCAIEGNFDNAQTGVKDIFADAMVAKKLDDAGWMLSSANSINLGRLLPQIAYYVSAYCDLITEGTITYGQPLDVTVPTGNFGNILAAYYAKQMGLPLGRLVCASNRNDVLTRFLQTGVYDIRRELHLTSSPSMDILVSSNFERALFHLSGGDAALVATLMTSLSKDGYYSASQSLKATFDEAFIGDSCDDATVSKTISDIWSATKTLIDPHTAVAVHVAQKHLTKSPMLVVSTASPFKFVESVSDSLGVTAPTLTALEEFTELRAPACLQALETREVRFQDCISIPSMPQKVLQFLNLT